MTDKLAEEAARIEGIWGGEFGNEYLARNPVNPDLRREFWRGVIARFPASRILEVGCNLGANLRPLAEVSPASALHGIDINRKALEELHRAQPGFRLVRAGARTLPFPDRAFDLVFTCGVLIHQPPELLPEVMAEIVRCSDRYVLCAEYFAPSPTEVAYRGQTRALFKNDFGRLYEEGFKLELRERRRLTGAGWDEVTFWALDKGVRSA